MPLEHLYQIFLNQNPYPRQLKSVDVAAHHEISPMYVDYKGKKLINFSSSDYLGLSKHPLLIQRSHEYAKAFGVGSASSRLVSGNFSAYDLLEKKIAAAMGKPTSLILGAGYQANTSVLEALLDPTVLKAKPLVFCDRLCHNSLISMTRYFAEIKRFHHNDLSHLEQLLEKHKQDKLPKFILVESIYSMDGDQVDFEKLIPIAKKYDAFLYVDDAHAVGVYGKYGFGKAPEFATDIDIIMGTFSKGLGSFGAYIACSKTMRDYLINKCKGLIYSTATSPAVLGAIDAALELVPVLQQERQRIENYASRFRELLKINGLNYGNSNTHIVPWIVGDAKKTLEMSALLEEHGILGATIRPPSVPLGKSRIRFCLTAAHTEEDFEHLCHVIHKIKRTSSWEQHKLKKIAHDALINNSTQVE